MLLLSSEVSALSDSSMLNLGNGGAIVVSTSNSIGWVFDSVGSKMKGSMPVKSGGVLLMSFRMCMTGAGLG